MTFADSAQQQALPQLGTFSKVAELGSFTAAGRELGITQAAVSQRVQLLERTLDVALFSRSGGRISLTDSGVRLYEYAQRILDLHREARQVLTGDELPLEGELLLEVGFFPGERLLPAALAVFRDRHPAVRVHVSVADSTAVLDHVESGGVQLGLAGRQIEKPHLEFRSFASDELVLILAPGDQWVRRRHVRIPDLLKRPLILRESGSASRWCLEYALQRAGHGTDELNVVLELGSNEAVKEAVLNRTGIAVISRLAVQRELDTGCMYAVRIDGLQLTRSLFAVSDSRRALPRPARTFLRFLLSESEALRGSGQAGPQVEQDG